MFRGAASVVLSPSLHPEEWASWPAFFWKVTSADQSAMAVEWPRATLFLCIKSDMLMVELTPAGCWHLVDNLLSLYLPILSHSACKFSGLPVQSPTLLLHLLSACLGDCPRECSYGVISEGGKGFWTNQEDMRAKRSYCVLTRTPWGLLKVSECVKWQATWQKQEYTEGFSSVQARAARLSK